VADPSKVACALLGLRRRGHTQHGVTAGQRRGDVEIPNYLRDQAGSLSLVFDSSLPTTGLGQTATCSKIVCSHTPRTSMNSCVLLRSVDHARSMPMGNNTLTIRTFLFSPQSLVLAAARRVFASYFSAGPPGDRGTLQLECHRKTTKRTRSVSRALLSSSP
jgi:hypothetical protein